MTAILSFTLIPSDALPASDGVTLPHWSALEGDFGVKLKVWRRPVQHPDSYGGQVRQRMDTEGKRVTQTAQLDGEGAGLGEIQGTLVLEPSSGEIRGTWRSAARPGTLRLKGRALNDGKVVYLRGAFEPPDDRAPTVPVDLEWTVTDSRGHLITAYIKVPVVGRVRFAELALERSH